MIGRVKVEDGRGGVDPVGRKDDGRGDYNKNRGESLRGLELSRQS